MRKVGVSEAGEEGRAMSALREYVKLRYMGDCKCGDCQLVPTKVLYEQDRYIDQLEAKVAELQSTTVSVPAPVSDPNTERSSNLSVLDKPKWYEISDY